MSKWICAALVLLAGTAAAQEPGGEEEFDLKAAIRKVTELMRASEKSLVEALGKDGSAGSAAAGNEARKALDDILRDGRDRGQEAADLLQEIIEKAPVSQGQGQGQEQQKPNDGEEQKRREQEQKAKDRDHQNSDGDKPEDGESKTNPEENTAKPPPGETDDPATPDPAKEWLGRLPDQIKQAVMNGEYDKIPARFRELLQKYFKKVAEVESDR